MFIATSRKLQALGLLIAETKVTEAAAGERTAAIRAVVAQVIPIAGTVVLGLFVLGASSALLPTFNVLLVLLVVVGLDHLAALAFVHQGLLESAGGLAGNLRATARAPAVHRAAALPSLLREADLETVTLAADSPAAGKLIRELELRTRTGASIVGIERNGANIINPGPDEELQAGDQVLLLGSPTQLEKARKHLLNEAD